MLWKGVLTQSPFFLHLLLVHSSTRRLGQWCHHMPYIPKGNDKQRSDYSEGRLQDWDGFQWHFIDVCILFWSHSTYSVFGGFLTHFCFLCTRKLPAHLGAEYQKGFLLHFTTLRLKGSHMATPRQPIHTSFLLTQPTEPDWQYDNFTLVRHACNICCRFASAVCDISLICHQSAEVWLTCCQCNKRLLMRFQGPRKTLKWNTALLFPGTQLK